MKIKIQVEYEVNPHSELSSKAHSNLVGALNRLTRNRVTALLGKVVGGDQVETGWESEIRSVEVAPVSKI